MNREYIIDTSKDKTRNLDCSSNGLVGIILTDGSRKNNCIFRVTEPFFPIRIMTVERSNLKPKPSMGGFFIPRKKKEDEEVDLSKHRGIDY